MPLICPGAAGDTLTSRWDYRPQPPQPPRQLFHTAGMDGPLLPPAQQREAGFAIRLSGWPGLAARLVERHIGGQVIVHEVPAEAEGELYYECYPNPRAEFILAAVNTGESQQVKVTMEALQSAPEAELDISLLPDL